MTDLLCNLVERTRFVLQLYDGEDGDRVNT